MAEDNIIWSDRKRTIFGLPWSFTRYRLTKEKLIIETGLFSRSEEEIRLYRILDISLKRKFRERLFGLGTIHLCSGDKTSPEIDIKRIKNSKKIKNAISDLVEEQRIARRVGMREYMNNDADDDDLFHDDDDGDLN